MGKIGKIIFTASIVLLGLPVLSHAVPVFNPTTGHYYETVYGHTWEETEAAAVVLGGHLVTINDGAEQQWLVTNFLGMFIIGFNDIQSEGTWVWSSGEAATYTNWVFGTSGGDVEDMVIEDMAIIFSTQSGGLWYSRDPSLSGSYNGIAEYGGGGAHVPEPSTLLLLASGLAGLAAWRKRSH